MAKALIRIEAEMDMPDDPHERTRDYGTADLRECCRIEQTNDPVSVLALCGARVVKYSITPKEGA